MARANKSVWILPAVLLAFLTVYLAGARMASHLLKRRLAASFGQSISFQAIDFYFDRLRFRGVSYSPTDEGSPARGSVENILIRPDFRALFTGRIDIASLRIVKPDLRFRLGKSPSGRTDAGKGSRKGAASVSLRSVDIEDGSILVTDPKVPNSLFPFRKVGLHVGGLTFPSGADPITFSLKSRLESPASTGRLTAEGSSDLQGKEIEATIRLTDADLTLFEPYYRKLTTSEIESGRVGLDLTVHVRDGLMEAPGVLHLEDLRFRPSSNPLSNFMGMPISLIAALLKDSGGRIDIEFTLRGRTDDPSFSFTQQLLRKIAVSLAEKAGRTAGDTGGRILEPAKKELEELGQGLGRSLNRLLKNSE